MTNKINMIKSIMIKMCVGNNLAHQVSTFQNLPLRRKPPTAPAFAKVPQKLSLGTNRHIESWSLIFRPDDLTRINC